MEPFYLAGAADRHARVTSRRAYLDFPVRRSMSVDTPTRTSTHHHDNHSLGGDSYSDEDDERYLSPLPCQEGCRALYSKLMSPMISSVAIDRSVSLTREGEGASNQAEADEDHLKTGNHSLPGTDAVKKAQVDPKQAAYAARKSVRELYGKPCWWGDDDDSQEDKAPSKPTSAQPSGEVSTSKTPTSPGPQAAFIRPPEAFTIDLNGVVTATPRRQAEAFTIDLADTANRSPVGGACVPNRLRRAIQDREQTLRQMSSPTSRPPASTAAKKTTLKTTSGQASTPRQSTTRPKPRSQVGAAAGDGVGQKTTPFSPRSKTAVQLPSDTSPKSVARKSTPNAAAAKGTKPPALQASHRTENQKPPPPRNFPNPLAQRNRIPLRQSSTPLSSARTSASNRRPVERGGCRGARQPTTTATKTQRSTTSGAFQASAGSPTSPSGAKQSSHATPRSAAHPPGPRNKAYLKRETTPLSNDAVSKGSPGSPFERRITSSVRTESRRVGVGAGRQLTPVRSTLSEEKRAPASSLSKHSHDTFTSFTSGFAHSS
uniref:TPX2 domain-containing protein n=1 Tax=Mesocestoides corti TaxID=53468 RepID=A0A5K3EN72_MESCO